MRRSARGAHLLARTSRCAVINGDLAHGFAVGWLPQHDELLPSIVPDADLALNPMILSSPLVARSNSSRRGGMQEAAEGGAFHVPRRRAGSGVAQAVAHGA